MWAYIIAGVGLVLTILNIVDRVITLKAKALEPAKKQDERIAALESKIKDMERFMDNDKRSIDELRASTNIILRVLFVLLNHEVSGNSVDKIKETLNDLQIFLTNRGINV